MSGFELFSTGVIEFHGTRYDGAKVDVRLDVSLAELQHYEGLGGPEQVEWLLRNVVKSWNLEKDGKPIPLDTPASELPLPFLSTFNNAWYSATVKPSAPLVEDSPSGDMSGEVHTGRQESG